MTADNNFGKGPDKKPVEKRQAPKKPIKIDRVCAVVEVHTPQGIFIPLLFNKSRGEWEIVGGGVERDEEYEKRSQQFANELQQTYLGIRRRVFGSEVVYEEIDPGDDPVPETAVRAFLERTERELSERVDQWQKSEITREMREELGFTQEPTSIGQLPYKSMGRNDEQTHFYVTGGSGRQLEVQTIPFRVRFDFPTLPTSFPQEEHSRVIFVAWPGWDHVGEFERSGYIQLLRQTEHGVFSLVGEEDGTFGFAAFTNETQSIEMFQVSKITSATLRQFFNATFAEPKQPTQ